MTLEDALLSVPINDWRTGQVAVLDWYDGPREGFCALSHPDAEFYFELLEERLNPDGLDDRLFQIREVSAGSTRELSELLASSSEDARQTIEAILNRKNSTRPSPLVVSTPDMKQFLGVWNIEQTSRNGKGWFATLGVPAISG